MIENITLQILLAILQGATEFLPVSSSGHLALFSNLFSTPDVAFFVTLHLGSLLAVLFFTRKEIYELLHFRKNDLKFILFLIIATIPAALVGVFLKSFVEKQFGSLLFLSLAFIFTGFILFFTKYSKEKTDLNIKNSIFIGIGQALAVFPGISRSGLTISSAEFVGIEKQKAVKFSFLLFIPVVLGATIIELKNSSSIFSLFTLVPLLVSAISSFIFMKALQKIVSINKFWIFSFYCWLVGIFTFLLWLIKI